MSWIKGIREQPWRVTVAAVAGLLVAITVAGLVGLLLIRSIENVTDEALRYDVNLEDEGDEAPSEPGATSGPDEGKGKGNGKGKGKDKAKGKKKD